VGQGSGWAHAQLCFPVWSCTSLLQITQEERKQSFLNDFDRCLAKRKNKKHFLHTTKSDPMHLDFHCVAHFKRKGSMTKPQMSTAWMFWNCRFRKALAALIHLRLVTMEKILLCVKEKTARKK